MDDIDLVDTAGLRVVDTGWLGQLDDRCKHER